jgi:hypothetical protein
MDHKRIKKKAKTTAAANRTRKTFIVMGSLLLGVIIKETFLGFNGFLEAV